MSRRSPVSLSKAWLLANVIIVAHAVSGLSQVSRPDHCANATIVYNQNVTWSYTIPGGSNVAHFQFYFGTSQTFVETPPPIGVGYYPWSDITSVGGGALLTNIKTPYTCYDDGLVTGSDTTWLPRSSSGTLTGDLKLLYDADDSQQYCNGIPVDDASGCVDNGEGGGGASYGDGSGTVNEGGGVTCWWADYYDDNWNYLYSVALGCTSN